MNKENMILSEETKNSFLEELRENPNDYASIQLLVNSLNLLSGIMIMNKDNPYDTDCIRDVAAALSSIRE